MTKATFLILSASALLATVMIYSNAGIARDAVSQSVPLKPVSSFDNIADERARSVALFGEVGKVLTHPRCTNCHPRTDSPLQGEKGDLHQPKVVRGVGGMGAPGMNCTTCHGMENFGNVPGNPSWHLAPSEMAWAGVPLDAICEQIKDPERNGGKSLDAIHKHMVEDSLVGYGWNAPAHLQPAPGSQRQLGELTRAWIDSGAHCPTAKEKDGNR